MGLVGRQNLQCRPHLTAARTSHTGCFYVLFVEVICDYLAFLGLGKRMSLILSNNIAIAQYYPFL